VDVEQEKLNRANELIQQYYKSSMYEKIVHTAFKRFRYIADVAGIANLMVWKAALSYNPQNQPFTTFLQYFRCCFYNELTTQLRKKESEKIFQKALANSFTLCYIGESKEDKAVCREFLECLSQDEKKLIKERFYEGFTFEELGQIYQCSYETVRQRISRILQKIRCNSI
jgi:RNA polymerase sigma factor (sigma-70 family)